MPLHDLLAHQWQHLHPLQSSFLSQSMAPSHPLPVLCPPLVDSNTINLLTCSAAGLLPPLPPNSSAIADDLLTSLLSSPPGSSNGGKRTVQKRSFNASFPEAACSDGGEEEENMSQKDEKKCRRLTAEQVRALEKAFEEENKLEPERKMQLANEVGLQKRQVAIWFQNRRARWRTKQIEKDYGVLKQEFESMKAHRDALLREKEKLQMEVIRLKGNLIEDAFDATLIKGSQSPLKSTASEASSVEESINIIHHPTFDEQREIDGYASSGESSEDINAITSSHHNNVYVIAKNFIGPEESLENIDATTSLHVSDILHGRDNLDAEPSPQLAVKNDEGSGGWFLSFDW